jgi:thiamine pyrophosphate-dependent acetolactate synthase large subunit-like protein/cytochrome P450
MHNRHLFSNALGRRRFADELVDYLISLGVEYLFGMPAESVNSLVHAASRRSEIEVVSTRHEAAAALMAVGYARTSGRLGVCFGTAGPGATNLLTGTYEAFVGRVPLLAISGQVPVASVGRDSFQEIDSAALFSSCTASSVQINATSQFERFARSCTLAMHEATACHVAIPGDVLYSPIGALDTGFRTPDVPSPSVASKEELREVLEFLDADDLAIAVSDDTYIPLAQELSARLECSVHSLADDSQIHAGNVLLVGRSSPLIKQRVHAHANLLELTDRRFTARSTPYARQIICDVDATLRAALGSNANGEFRDSASGPWQLFSDLNEVSAVLPDSISLNTAVVSSLAGIQGAALPLGIGGALADRAASRNLVVTDYRQLGQFVAELSSLPSSVDLAVICVVDDRETLSRITRLGPSMSLRTATAESVEDLSRVLSVSAAPRCPALIGLLHNAFAPPVPPQRLGELSLAAHLRINLATPVQISESCASVLPFLGATQRSVNAQAPSMNASALRKMGVASAGTVAATGAALLLQLNGIYDAALDNARILVVTVEPQAWSLDACRLLDGVTAARYVVDNPTTAATTVQRACATAASPGAGIVHLQVLPGALDVEWYEHEPGPAETVTPRHPAAAPDPSALKRAVAALRDARRVAIVAGRGAAGCSNQLAELSGLLGCRVHLTMGGDSVISSPIVRSHSRIGGSGDLRAFHEVARADVLLLIGVSNRGSAFELRVSGRTIAVNLDPNTMLRLGEHDICVLGDAMAALESIVAALRVDSPSRPPAPPRPSSRRKSSIAQRVSRRAENAPLRASSLTQALDEELRRYDGSCTVCADVGVNTLWVYRYITSMTHSIWSASFGTMGFAVPAAITVARNSAAPTLVVAVAGDGGTGITLSQIASSAGLTAPVVFVVVNNMALAAIKYENEIMGWPDRGSALPDIDFAQYAASVGVPSRRVDTLREFRATFKEAISGGGPYLIDARCVLNDAPVQAGKKNWRQVMGFFVAWSQEGRAGLDSFGEVLRAVVRAKLDEKGISPGTREVDDALTVPQSSCPVTKADHPRLACAQPSPLGGPRSTGRRSVVSSLRPDPLWPTRLSVSTLSGAARGFGRPTPLPPGPKGLPVVGSFFQLRRDPFEFMKRGAARYGDIFRAPLPLLDLVAVTHPDLVHEFMEEPTGRFSRYGPVRPMLSIIGANSIMLDGPKLRERRGMLTPMFARRHQTNIAEVVSSELARRLDGWAAWAATGRPVNLQDEIFQTTLSVYLRALFSVSVSDPELRQLDADMRAITGLLGLTTLMVPFPRLNVAPALARTYRLVGRLIRERKARPLDVPDFLDTLLEARYQDGSPMSKADLAAEIVGLLGGAYDPSAAALTWAVALLVNHPDQLATLLDEIDALGGAPPGYDDLPRLEWTKACFDEAQRMQGHPFFPRYCMEDTTLGDYRLPKYTLLGASMSVIHRDPRWWPEPDRYEPARFLDREQIQARPRLAFMPFSAGQHFCMGTQMAYMTAQFFLATLFQRYRLSVPQGWRPQPHFTFSVTVKGGLPVRLSEV